MAPEGMTCEAVATSWVPECQDQDPDIAVSYIICEIKNDHISFSGMRFYSKLPLSHRLLILQMALNVVV